MKKDIKDLKFKVAVSTTKFITEDEKKEIKSKNDYDVVNHYSVKNMTLNEVVKSIQDGYSINDIHFSLHTQNFNEYQINDDTFVQTNMVALYINDLKLDKILPNIKMLPSFSYVEDNLNCFVYVFQETIKSEEEYEDLHKIIKRSLLTDVKDLKIGGGSPYSTFHTKNEVINNNVIYNKFDFNFYKNDYNIDLTTLKEEVINNYQVVQISSTYDFENEENCEFEDYFIIDKKRLKFKRLCEIKKEGYNCERLDCSVVDTSDFEFDFGIDFEEEENIIDSFNKCFNTNFEDIKEIQDENNEAYNYFIEMYKLKYEYHTRNYVLEYEFNNEYRVLNNDSYDDTNDEIIFLEDKELERDLIIEYLSMTHKLFMNNNKVEEFKYLEDYDIYMQVNNDNQNFYVARTHIYDINDENL